MLVSEVMTKGVECIGPDASVEEAAQRMKAFRVGVASSVRGGSFHGDDYGQRHSHSLGRRRA